MFIDGLKLLNLIMQVDVLPSLQKPKKITIRGSDGNSYTMMCKPKVSQDERHSSPHNDSIYMLYNICCIIYIVMNSMINFNQNASNF